MINVLKLKFGFKALLRNPLRIIVSVITTIIAVGLAGMCIFTSTYDIIEWEKDMFFHAYDDESYTNICVNTGLAIPSYYNAFKADGGTDAFSKEKYLSIVDSVEKIGGGYATMYWSAYSSSPERNFSVYNLFNYLGVSDTVKTGEEALYAEYNGETLIAPYANFSKIKNNIDSVRGMISRLFFSAITVYSGEEALEDFCYTLVGKLPEEMNEVAIPQWLYNSFLCYGYRNPETGEVTEISSEEDIIGKPLRLTGDRENHENKSVDATIVGVIHSDLNDGFMSTLEFDDEGKLTDVSASYSLPPYLGVAVSEKFFEYGRKDATAYGYEEAYVNCVTVSRNSEHAEEYFDYVTEWKVGKSFSDIVSNPEVFSTTSAKYAMASRVKSLYTKLPRVFDGTTIYFQIIQYTTPFAIILLIYFAFSTVFGKRRDIGVFRSLGMSKTKIWLSFLIPLAAVAIVASLGGLTIEISFMNHMNTKLFTIAQTEGFVGYYPFTLTPLTLLFTFGAPILTVTFASAVTLLLLTRKSVRSLVAK